MAKLQKKKILIVTTIGGFLQQFEMNNVHILQEYGFEVHYASNFDNMIYESDRDSYASQGIVCHPIEIQKSPLRIFENFRAFCHLRRIIDEENIQAVHCHNPTGGVLARLAAVISRQKPKVIYTAHGLHFYRGAKMKNWILYYPVEWFCAHFTDCLITINKEDRIRAGHFRLKPGGIVRRIHGVGIDSDKFRKISGAREEVRKELGIPDEAFHIITAAELNANKDQKTVIEAIASLNDPDIYYSLCGKGPTADQLKQLISEKGLQNRVRLLGYQTHMEIVLQSADCFAFPSKREGLGVAAVEALACEIPVIAADNRGTREYMADGVNGIVCPAGSVEAFAEAIRTLKSDKEMYDRMAGRCRQSVEHFNLSDTDKRMRRIYRQVLE